MHKKIHRLLMFIICAFGAGGVNAQEIAVKQIGGCQGNKVLLAATTHSNFLGWERADGGKAGIFSPDSLVTWVQVEERTIFKAKAGSLQTLGPNLVKNGDFENDTIGLKTSYKYTTPRTDKAGDYIVTNSPNVGRSTPIYALIGDHTSGNGKMFMADGSKDSSNTVLSMTIPVSASATYTFQIWIANIHKKLIEPNTDTSERKLPRLAFRIDGSPLGEYMPPFDSLWHPFSVVWTGTKNSTVVLDIVDVETSAEGNDFVLDDISFRQSIAATQQASITVDPCLRTDVFSPDGDGVLDSYYIEEKGIAKIYDLDGNLIHELFTPTHWDGTKRTGGLADAGYYAVVINDNKSYRVSLMR